MPFPMEQYHELADTMRSIKGQAILSSNDHPDMRQVFKEFKQETVGIAHTQ